MLISWPGIQGSLSTACPIQSCFSLLSNLLCSQQNIFNLNLNSFLYSCYSYSSWNSPLLYHPEQIPFWINALHPSRLSSKSTLMKIAQLFLIQISLHMSIVVSVIWHNLTFIYCLNETSEWHLSWLCELLSNKSMSQFLNH